MTSITIGMWFALALAVSAAITACAAAWFGSVAHLSRRFTTLQERFDELADALSSHDTAILNLRARVGMQATRAKRQNAQTPSPDSSQPSADASEDERARVRRELGRKIHPLGGLNDAQGKR